MTAQLVRVFAQDKSILRNLIELYQYDFSEFDGTDVNAHGLYGYDYLDHYWTEPGRFAYFVFVEGILAGFAMVHDTPDPSGDVIHHIA